MFVNNLISNNTSSKNIQFKALKLETKTCSQANALIKDYAKKLPEEKLNLVKYRIFSLIDKNLQDFAKEKTKGYHDYDTILQRIYLMFFEALENFKQEEQPINKIIEAINKFKNNADDSKIGYFSLGKVPAKPYNEKYEAVVAETRGIEPLKLDYLSQKKASKKVQEIIFLPELDETDAVVLKERAKGSRYLDIGGKLGISKVKAREKVLTAIAKIQESQSIAPESFDTIAKNLINRLGLKKDISKVKKLVIKNLCLREKSIDFLDENSTNIAKALEIEKETFTNSAIEQPQVMLLKPETVLNNITTTAQLLNIDKKRYLEAALRQPSLMYQTPQSICKKVQEASELLGISSTKFIELALRTPTMFYQNPKTLARKATIMNYYKKLQNKNNTELKTIPLKSDDKLFSNSLKYLISKETEVQFDYTYKEDDLIEFLKNNSDKTFQLKLIPDPIVEDFVEYSSKLSESICGRNIFEFVVQCTQE